MTKFYLICPDFKPAPMEIALGTVTDMTKRIDITANQTPMPTQDSSKAFCMDSGGTMKIDLTIKRRNGQDGMTNAVWIERMSSLVDRWQAVTDGCIFMSEVSKENLSELDSEYYNVYIDEFSYDYSSGNPEEISSTVILKVGSMFGIGIEQVTIPKSDSYINISSSSGNKWFTLMSESSGLNCVESCVIEGGLGLAFEYVTLKVPKRRLESYAKELVEKNDIIAGRNLIRVHAHGDSEFVLTRCKLRGTTYTITGYAKPEMLRGTATVRDYGFTTIPEPPEPIPPTPDETNPGSEAMSIAEPEPAPGEETPVEPQPEPEIPLLSDTPWGIISEILSIGVEFGTKSTKYLDEDIITNVDKNAQWMGDVFFPQSSNAWYVLQVCALKLGAKIWFSEGKCYIMNVTDFTGFNKFSVKDEGPVVELYPDKETSFSKNIVGSAETGDEGNSSIVNVCEVSYTGPNGNTDSVVVNGSEESRRYYGERRGSLSILEIRNLFDAVDVANGFMNSLTDSQNAISFKIRDTNKNGWIRVFSPVDYAEGISDSVSDIYLSNKSHSSSLATPGLLMVSQYRYCYPDNVSEYTWGIQQSADLSQTISQIFTALKR